MTPGPPIVVGLDGSESSVHALVWAVREGAQRARPVAVLTAWPLHAAVLVHEVPGHYSDARGHALDAQRRALRQAGARLGSVPAVAVRLVNTGAAEALLEASLTSELIVIGSRDPQSAGPVARRCLQESRCSVSVVGPSAVLHRGRRSLRPARAEGADGAVGADLSH